LAATNAGLVEQRGGTQYVLEQHNGPPCRRIYTIVTGEPQIFRPAIEAA
jgi:hypothetical protein